MINFISGLLTAVFIFLVLTYFRSSIDKRMTIIERKVQDLGPKPKGFIIENQSDAEIAREEIIERNKKAGKVTRMEELL